MLNRNLETLGVLLLPSPQTMEPFEKNKNKLVSRRNQSDFNLILFCKVARIKMLFLQLL
jgi:hypothetical protein